MCECPTMYEENIARSRKQRRCVECGGQIAVGDKYQSVSGMWDGRFDRISTCLACVDTRSQATAGLKTHDCCDLPCFGELYQYVSDGMPDTAALVDTMKQRIQLGKFGDAK